MMYSFLMACAVCFQPGHRTSEAVGWAILVLLVIVTCVLGGLVALMIHLARRSKAVAQQELLELERAH